jgi:hypothetical protein
LLLQNYFYDQWINLDRAICRHYISICKLKNLWLNDDEKEFYIVKARGRPKKSNNGALKKI